MANLLDNVFLQDGTCGPENERLLEERVDVTCGHPGCKLVDDGKMVELQFELAEA